MNKIGIIHYGLGAMGGSMVRIVAEKKTLQSVGAICRAYPESKGAAKVKDGKAVIILDTIGMLNPDEDGFETGDATFIEGEPNIDLVIKGELAQKAGVATAAHAVNSIPRVMAAGPGLITIKDIPAAVALR